MCWSPHSVDWGCPTLTAPHSQAQLSPGPRSAYRECLGKLDLQYGKLLVRGQRGAVVGNRGAVGQQGIQGGSVGNGGVMGGNGGNRG